MLEKMFNIWKNVLTDPKQTFKKQIGKSDYREAVKHIGIAGIVAGFILGLALMVLGSVAGAAFGKIGALFGASTGIALFLSTLIIYPIVLIISLFISSGIFYIFARLLGGKGSYKNQTYLIAIYQAPLTILTVFLMLIPIAGTIMGFLVGLYGLYLLVLVLMQTHKYSLARAIGTLLLPFVIIMIFFAVLAFLVISLAGLALFL